VSNDSYSNSQSGRALRTAVCLSFLVLCLLFFWTAAKAGVARFLGRYVSIAGDLTVADRSVSLAPSDPESHKTKAAVLYQSKQFALAISELELAISLRPRDDYLWLQLGMAREAIEDAAGAALAFNESVRLAPYYALAHWQRGNFLLRQGKLEEGFADLRHASASNPDYRPILIDLAWGISKGDQRLTETYAQIATPEMHLAFAELLARQGKGQEALEQLSRSGSIPERTRKELVRHLISANDVKTAFKIWSESKNGTTLGIEVTTIYDGGFEGTLTLDEFGFGWRVFRGSESVRLTADSTDRHTGSKSVAIEFLGESNPDTPLLSQIILVKPSSSYRVSFAARAKEIVTGGPPVAVVSESAGSRKRLAESSLIDQKSSDWQVVSFNFQTEPKTEAITVSIQRRNCSTAPCPIFGSLWLDSFSIEELH